MMTGTGTAKAKREDDVLRMIRPAHSKRIRRTRFSTTFLGVLSCGALLLNLTAGARESSRGYDADLTLFSPEGRLYQVEYVMRAVGQYGCPVVGVHGEGCCVVACKRDVPDELVYPDSVSSIFRISDDIYSASTGLAGDVRYQVKRARLKALEYKKQHGSPMPSRLLTMAMADAAQVNTQYAALRPMACVSFMISVDDPTGPALFRVEPSGQVFQAWGAAAGRGSAASLEFLEEAFAAAERNGSGGSAADDNDGPSGSRPRGRTKSEDVAFSVSQPAGEEQDESDGDRVAGKEVNASSVGAKERDTSGGRGKETDGVAKKTSDGDGGGGGERGAGFGVVGEDATVKLALQALSKASSSKGAQPLSDKNVEIAIASKKTGIRVCSREEVKGFLSMMALSADCMPKVPR